MYYLKNSAYLKKCATKKHLIIIINLFIGSLLSSLVRFDLLNVTHACEGEKQLQIANWDVVNKC